MKTNRKPRPSAIKDGRILAVGGAGEIAELAGPDTDVIDLDGRVVIPGFIEGHGHFLGLGPGSDDSGSAAYPLVR